MTTRDHHVVGMPPDWSRRGNGFHPLTLREGHDWRKGAAIVRRARPQAIRRRPSAFHRAGLAMQAMLVRLFPNAARWRAWLRIFNLDPRFAAGFAVGEAWVILVMGGVWLLIQYL